MTLILSSKSREFLLALTYQNGKKYTQADAHMRSAIAILRAHKGSVAWPRILIF